MQRKIARIVIGSDKTGHPVTADNIGVTGALTILMRDTVRPNLIQTLEGTSAFLHDGPGRCPEIQNTWEPPGNLTDCYSKLVEFLTTKAGAEANERVIKAEDDAKIVNVRANEADERIRQLEAGSIGAISKCATYDAELEKKAAEIKSCEDVRPETGYRGVLYVSDYSDGSVEDIYEYSLLLMRLEANDKMDKYKDVEKAKEAYMKNKVTPGMFNPLQTRIGCANFQNMCANRHMGVCLLGPLNSVYENEKKGDAGSQCPGEKTKEKLCKTPSPMT